MKKVLLLILLIGQLPLQAQQQLTLEACREMALQNSDNIKIAGLQIEKARAEQAVMKTQYLPSLSGNATGIYLHNNIDVEMFLPTVVPNPATGELVPNLMTHPITGQVITGPDGNPVFNVYAWLPLEISLQGAYLAGVSIEQPVYTGGKINAGMAMTRIGLDMASENLRMQHANTIYETDHAYWLYVTVQEKVRLAEAYAQLLAGLESQTQHAWETGYITRNEYLGVVVKHNEAKLQLQKAQSGRELARMALCRLIGLPLETAVETTDTSTTHNSFAHIINTSYNLSNRPEYRLLEKNIDMAWQQLKISRADFLPSAGISAGYNFVGGLDIGTTSYDEGNASIIASVKIPLFHWGEGRKKQLVAKHEIEIRRAELAKNSGLLTLEIENARLGLADAIKRIGLSEQALLHAEENLQENRDNYELNMRVLTDLLQAQAQWQQAYSEIIDARAELRLKETAWRRATGNLSD